MYAIGSHRDFALPFHGDLDEDLSGRYKVRSQELRVWNLKLESMEERPVIIVAYLELMDRNLTASCVWKVFLVYTYIQFKYVMLFVR